MIEIGQNIRKLRTKSKRNIQRFSEDTGLSTSHLSKIERGLVSPSLEALEKIASALEVPVTSLFSNKFHHNPVTRKDERVQVHLPSRIVEPLMNSSDKHSFGAYFCTESEEINGHRKRADSEKGTTYFSHTGEELIHVLEGELHFTLGKEEYHLKEGDSIYFDANIEHSALRLTPHVKLLIITNPATTLSGMHG